jgi:hypothetical protein
MGNTTTLSDTRSEHAEAAAELQIAKSEANALRTALVLAQNTHKHSEALELQTKLALANQRVDVAHQIVQMRAARLKREERVKLAELKASLTAAYRAQCDEIVQRLAELMHVHQRLDLPVELAAQLRLPALEGMRANDFGAYRCGLDVVEGSAAAARSVEAMLDGR